MGDHSVIEFLPIFLMFLVALGFVVFTIWVTHKLGPRKKTEVKNEAFECGIESVGNARTPFSIKYFLVAILFVLFDIEVIFMYPWAVNFRQLGIWGLIEMFIYVSILLIGFAYIIKKDALKWD